MILKEISIFLKKLFDMNPQEEACVEITCTQ